MTEKKATDNNNANQSIKDAKIVFPVTFELKTVLDASSADDENMKNISTVF